MGQFSVSEWAKIFTLLDEQPQTYGLPKKRRKSVVIASWNIRKFGAVTDSEGDPRRSAGAWDLITEFCRHCDVVAIQEVQDSLESIRQLRDRLGRNYRIVVSDIAGGVPGASGLRERLALLYNSKRVTHTELASDITFERSAIFRQLYDNRGDFFDAFLQRTQELNEWQRAKKTNSRKRKPTFVLPHFVQFIRSPHIASMEILGKDNAEPYELLFVNAHLLYGDKSKQREERRNEFKALLAWLIDRARETDKNYADNVILCGDLNLDFRKADREREAISRFIKSINDRKFKGTPARVNFPFIDQHPDQTDVFRTNARRNETFDHIALFTHDPRLPLSEKNDEAGQNGANGYDYGMFDFVQLFFDAHPSLTQLTGRGPFEKFEHDVSDHMPIWIRLPLPT